MVIYSLEEAQKKPYQNKHQRTVSAGLFLPHNITTDKWLHFNFSIYSLFGILFPFCWFSNKVVIFSTVVPEQHNKIFNGFWILKIQTRISWLHFDLKTVSSSPYAFGINKQHNHSFFLSACVSFVSYRVIASQLIELWQAQCLPRIWMRQQNKIKCSSSDECECGAEAHEHIRSTLRLKVHAHWTDDKNNELKTCFVRTKVACVCRLTGS